MLQLTIEKLIAGGDGLSRHNGKVLFIPGSVPGDQLSVEITQEKKGFSRARILEIKEASEDRQEPFCPHYGNCGGCNWQHIKYPKQLEYKKILIEEIFQRAGIKDFPDVEIHQGKNKAYRSRVQFHHNLGKWGFLKKGSKELVEIEYCPLLCKGLNDFLKNPPSNILDERLNLFGTSENYFYDPQKEITLSIEDKKLHFHSGLFFQSNSDLLADFIKTVCADHGGGKFLDLYGGVGLFSAFLEDRFQSGILVESNRNVEPWVRKNCSKKVRFVGKALEKWKEKPNDVDLVVVDPPRVGMDRKALLWLTELKAPNVVYVSCDPVTQARDITELLKSGYKILSFHLFDFYPHSAHMETVIQLAR